MILGDRQLFSIRIAVHIDNFHTIQQRRRNRLDRVGSGNEQTLRQIDRQLDEMIAELLILVGIQHLKQRAGWIAVRVHRQFVHLVEQDDGIHIAGEL